MVWASLSPGSEVLASGTVRDLVGELGIEVEDRRRRAPRGVPDERSLFAVVGS
jgi:hypothetical protein